jgi:lipopolysaccharide/colanic/teichoic acid biosynthesis glycosyltransferase
VGVAMDEKRQVQKELFEDFVSREKKSRYGDLFQKKPKISIILCFEHIVIVFIVFIIILAVVFSIGVEKGRSVSSSFVKQAREEVYGREHEIAEHKSAVFKQQDDAESTEPLLKASGEETPFSFTIQVASYKREDTAKRHAEELKLQGNDAFVLQKGDYYITCVGKFVDSKSADSQMKKLRKSYSDCLVRRI